MSGFSRGDFIFYFQEVPPVGNAVSMRAKYFLNEIVNSLVPRGNILVRTATTNPDKVDGITFKSFPAGTTDSKSTKSRILSEIMMGLLLTFDILWNYKRKVVVISSPSYIVMLLGGSVARLLSKQLILDIRDIYPQAYEATGLIKKTSFIYKIFYDWSTWLYRSSVLVTVATDDLNKKISMYTGNVITIFNGYPQELTLIEENKYNSFTVCFHGLLGRFQDVGGLISVARKLENEDIDFIFIGYGPKSVELEGCLPSNCCYLGKLPNSETIKIIAKCHVGLSLRTNDAISVGSFPVKIWEYIGLGIEVISSPLTEAGEFLEENGLGYQYSWKDYDGIALKIKELKLKTVVPQSSSLDIAYYSRESQSKLFVTKLMLSLEKRNY